MDRQLKVNILIVLIGLLPPLTCSGISVFSAYPQLFSDLLIVGTWIGLALVATLWLRISRNDPLDEPEPVEETPPRRLTVSEVFLYPDEQDMVEPFRSIKLVRRMVQGIGGAIFFPILFAMIPFAILESTRASEFALTANVGGIFVALVAILQSWLNQGKIRLE